MLPSEWWSCHTFIQFLELKTMNSIDKKPPLPKKAHALPRRLTTETRISTERLPRGPTPTISQSSARTRKRLRVEMSRAEVLEHPCVCNSSPSLFFLPRPQAAPSAMHQQAKVWRPMWSRTERFTMNACYKWPSKLQKAALTIRNCSTRSFFVSLPVRCCKYGSSPVCAWWLLVLFHINPAYLRWLGSALCSPFTWHINETIDMKCYKILAVAHPLEVTYFQYNSVWFCKTCASVVPPYTPPASQMITQSMS